MKVVNWLPSGIRSKPASDTLSKVTPMQTEQAMPPSSSSLEGFRASKDKVLALLKETMSLSREFEAARSGDVGSRAKAAPSVSCSTSKEDSLRVAYDDLLNDRFHVVVVGEFNRGKSYLINALLGSPVLPTGIRPTTAALTKISYGRECKVVIHYHDSLGRPPRIASLDELKQLVTALTPEGEEEAKKVKIAEITYDSPLCANGVTIIDTPGVNDLNDQREEVTYQFIPQSHAAIMVLDANMPVSDSEKRFLEEKILANDIRKIFFVLNKSSGVSPEELPEVIAYTKTNLERLRPLAGGVKLHAVDSRNALKAKREGACTPDLAAFLEFERTLGDFLVSEHGRLMISRPCARALRRLSELRDGVKAVKQMLSMDREKVLAKERELGDILRRTRERKMLLQQEIGRIMEGLHAELNDAAARIVEDALFDVESKTYESSVGVAELPRFARSEFQAALARRFDRDVKPLIAERITKVRAIVERDVEIATLQVDRFLSEGGSVNPIVIDDVDDGSVSLRTDDLEALKIGGMVGAAALAAALLNGLPALLLSLVGVAAVQSFVDEKVAPSYTKKKLLDYWRNNQEQLYRKVRDRLFQLADRARQDIESQIAPLMDSRLEEVSKAVAEAARLRAATEAEQKRYLAKLDDLEQRVSQLQQKLRAILKECGGDSLE